ncbi:hypothetical protein GCM10010151_54770 [Actinoallomurus spadix]|uniref:Uncharacterized protein n=1 Tax=Actinoallomurus spadix TaxID=79912 RepID=A0ABN0X956_9ACTN
MPWSDRNTEADRPHPPPPTIRTGTSIAPMSVLPEGDNKEASVGRSLTKVPAIPVKDGWTLPGTTCPEQS